MAPSYNIAPTDRVAAIRVDDNGARSFAWFSWGFVPAWSKREKTTGRLINARGETVSNKPSFRDAFRLRRCLIAADGFYEWRAAKPGEPKQPYLITLSDGGLFAFAGIWECSETPPVASPSAISTSGTCTIVTTVAASSISHIHHRMPLILSPSEHEQWLTAPVSVAQTLIRPSMSALLAYPVDARVNSVRNDDADLLRPVEVKQVDDRPNLDQFSLL